MSAQSSKPHIGQRVRCRVDGRMYLVVDFKGETSLVLAAPNGNEFVAHRESVTS